MTSERYASSTSLSQDGTYTDNDTLIDLKIAYSPPQISIGVIISLTTIWVAYLA